MEQLLDVLGKKVSDATVRQYLEGFDPVVITPPLNKNTDESYYSYFKSGISLVLDGQQIIQAVHVYVQPKDEFSAYRGPLPGALPKGLTKTTVRNALGTPAASGGGEKSVLYESTSNWDRYRIDRKHIHLQYDQEGNVDLITLMTEEATPL